MNATRDTDQTADAGAERDTDQTADAGAERDTDQTADAGAERDIDQAADAGAERELDPREAAALLEQTAKRARGQLTPRTTLTYVFAGIIVFVVYGALWLSVRGQQVYTGPSLGVIGLVYGIVVATAIVNAVVTLRTISGVGGRTRREQAITAIPLVIAIAGVYVFDGALKHNGFSTAIVYGVFDAAAPWLVVGAVMAGMCAAREQWTGLVGWVLVMAVGAGSVFAGPSNVWGVLAISGLVLLVGSGVFQTIRLRRTA